MGRHWQDSGFYAGADRIGTFVLTNLFSAFLLMTVIGAPFALLALFAVMNEWVQGRQPEFFRVYLGSIRQHWRVALGLGVIDLALGGLIFVNFSILQVMDIQAFLTNLSLMLTISFALLLLMANLYAWSIISLLGLSLRSTVKLSLLLVLSHPGKSLLITAATLVPLILSLFLPIAFALIVSLAAGSYIAARGVSWVLRRQFTADELASLMAQDE